MTPHSSLNLSSIMSLRSKPLSDIDILDTPSGTRYSGLGACSASPLPSLAGATLHFGGSFVHQIPNTAFLTLLQRFRHQMFRCFHVQSLAQCAVPNLPQVRHRCVHGKLAINLDTKFFWNCAPDPLCPEAPLYRCSFDDLGLL